MTTTWLRGQCHLSASRRPPAGSPPRGGLGASWPAAMWRHLASRAQTPDVHGGPAGAWVAVAARAEPRLCQGPVWTPVRGARGAQDAESQALPPLRAPGSADPTCRTGLQAQGPTQPLGGSCGQNRDVRSAGSQVPSDAGVRACRRPGGRGGEVSPAVSATDTPRFLPLPACPRHRGLYCPRRWFLE